MTTPQADAPATPATRPPDRFEQEVREKGYMDEADVTESAILRGLRRARRERETSPPDADRVDARGAPSPSHERQALGGE
jgi:hypothetical protein